MARSNSYREAINGFLAKVRKELDEGDLVQASEKLWGAAAQAVKAVAERRGWKHSSHRGLTEVVSRLSRETGDRELLAAWSVATGHHFNFYENVYSQDVIEDGLTMVGDFVRKVEQL